MHVESIGVITFYLSDLERSVTLKNLYAVNEAR